MPEFVCAFEIVRTFTDEEVAHNPDPEEVMAILVRQVEGALRTVGGVGGKVTFERLRYSNRSGWETAQSDGSMCDG
jgi:hypothetical protein